MTSSPPPAVAPSAAVPPPRRRRLRLWTRRTVWCPTLAGWLLLTGGAGAALAGWCRAGETFLSVTDRRGADVLVVEGWIGNSGVRAAAAEYFRGHYRGIVATSGLTSDYWDTERWSYAEMARRDLLAAGVPAPAILLAVPAETSTQRTFESAVATRRALREAGVHPRAVAVFTLGAHARRSRLVFEKVLRPDISVGVIAWRPQPDYDGAWWHSSERAEDLLKETAGYLFELLLDSGRWAGRHDSRS